MFASWQVKKFAKHAYDQDKTELSTARVFSKIGEAVEAGRGVTPSRYDQMYKMEKYFIIKWVAHACLRTACTTPRSSRDEVG